MEEVISHRDTMVMHGAHALTEASAIIRESAAPIARVVIGEVYPDIYAKALRDVYDLLSQPPEGEAPADMLHRLKLWVENAEELAKP